MNETDKPFLMNKHNFLHVYNTKGARDVGGDDLIPITLEQARALDVSRKEAGLAILRAAVAADNEAALAAAEGKAAAAPAPAIPSANISAAIAEKDAQIASLKAQIAEQAKKEAPAPAPEAEAPAEKGDPDAMSYEELKAAAAARGIDLGKTPRKADLIAALKAAGDTTDAAAATTEEA